MAKGKDFARVSQPVALGIILTAIATAALFFLWPPSAAKHLSRARELLDARDYAAAERAALAAIKDAPVSVEAVLLASDAAVEQGEFARAVNHLQGGVGHPEKGPSIRLRRARLLRYRLYRFDEAEAELRTLLEEAPDSLDALEELARLLGLCGRRYEAVPFVLRLIQGGRVNDLLILLARPDGRLNDPEALRVARSASPNDRNAALGEAVRLLSEEHTAEALERLRSLSGMHPSFAPAQAMLGAALTRAGTTEERRAWGSSLLPAALEFPESWRALSELAEQEGDRRGAIRCCWEEMRRLPESRATLYRLLTLLSADRGTDERADAAKERYVDRLRERFQTQQRLETAQNRIIFGDSRGEEPVELARLYTQVGRRWESLAWRTAAAAEGRLPRADAEELVVMRAEMSAWPLELTISTENPANWFDLSSYPLPRFPLPDRTEPAVRETASSLSPVRFRDDAETARLNFRYINGTDGPPTRRMYEFTGGGIGALDFDLDGFPDLCLSQGVLWGSPPGERVERDGLFRNENGKSFSDVSRVARFDGAGFGQGVSAGDVNNDGFPDVAVARIGKNELWLNNGDGTFEPVAGLESEPREWTTSIMLADVNEDGLPDRYDVNYVQGPDVFERVCRQIDGRPGICMPFDFDGAPDRLWISSGDGTWRRFAEPIDDPPGKGLGILAWDARGTGNIDLLIANDTTPNRFLIAENPGEKQFRLPDVAPAAGIALNAEGKATGSMGIALADLTGDGHSDVQITNFLAEASTLFTGQAGGLFEDRSKSLGLAEPTAATLGFGTQFLDADLDGRQELFLANGHIDDLERLNRPYRQSPQLFRFDDHGTVLVGPSSGAAEGDYFREKLLGRSAVRVDWNRDRLPDLVVGHLVDPYSLLTNVSPDAGWGLTLRLVGIRKSRDAVGARVRASASGRMQTAFVSAGDGYQASNERTVFLGFGHATRIDRLTVHWPGGDSQEFRDVALPASSVLVEGGELLRIGPNEGGLR